MSDPILRAYMHKRIVLLYISILTKESNYIYKIIHKIKNTIVRSMVTDQKRNNRKLSKSRTSESTFLLVQYEQN